MNVKGELLDDQGNAVAKTVEENVFRTGGPWGFVLGDTLDAGTYHLKVTGSDGSMTGPYTVLAIVDVIESFEYNNFRTACKQIVTGYSDPLYGCQWHLNNAGGSGATAGEDINVEDAWETYLGTGVPIAIVDGLMLDNHEDLVDNLDQSRSHNYRPREFFLFERFHSIRVAGVAAARDNDMGVRGVAPRATLYSYNLLDVLTLANLADAMTRNLASTGVSNNSWGFPDRPTVDAASRFWEFAVDRGVTAGYGGKGIFYVWAGGNGASEGDNSNLDGHTNYYAVTAVCAVNDQGVRSSYSEEGANLWVCAPSHDPARGRQGIVTTFPPSSYIDNFSGTSAATPIVSGVAALLREANSDLTWRDLKLILAASARKNDPTDTGWEEGAVKYGGTTEKYNFNHEYGFGVVDAKAAVDLAADWDLLPPMIRTDQTLRIHDVTIPDSGSVTSTVTVDSPVEFIEFVQIDTRFEAPAFRNLEVKLTSPAGEESVLSVPHSSDCSADACPLNGWYRFGSARHLGGDPDGTWTLKIADQVSGGTDSRLRSWGLTFYGHRATPGAPSIDSVSQGSDSLTVGWTAPTYEGTSDITSYDVRYIRGDATDKADGNWTVVDPAGTSSARRYTITSLTDGVAYDVGVRGVNDGGDGAWSETKAGTVGATNSPPAFTEGISTTRTVRENSAAGVNVGSPVTATDTDRDTLTYTLSGAGSDLFAVNDRSGQITVNNATGLDRETTTTYRPTVSVHDGKSPTGTQSTAIDDTITVTITISDVNEPPTISGNTNETHSEIYGPFFSLYQARDPENAVITWSLSGNDSSDFILNPTGLVGFRERPDYESPADSNRDNVYEFSLRASDGVKTATLDVTFTVTDGNDAPELSGESSVTYPENGTGTVATYQAYDPDNDKITWTLTGTDADDFAISDSGELAFLVSPDHEAPSDYQSTSDNIYADNVYQVTVNADDGTFGDAVAVVVTVTDVDEPGMVTVSSPHPQENTLLEATATDPDGTPTDVTWKWERSPNRSSWSTIANATSATYTPETADLEQYLRTSVTYTDKHGTGKTLSTISVTKTQAEPAANTAPSFPSTPVTRSIAENSPAGLNIGLPIAAIDAQSDPLVYSLSGTRSSFFTIEQLTGQLKTNNPLDHENPDHRTLTVTVTATDPSSESTPTLATINVTNVNEQPAITGQPTVSYAENGTATVHDYDDGDPEGDTVTWTVTGTDADDFTINSSGELVFDPAPDYEKPSDSNKDNTYKVIIHAADATLSDSKNITVIVTDINEPSVVTGPTTPKYAEGQTSLTVADFDAEDPERDDIIWRIRGTDRHDFDISDDGTVAFEVMPDYENPHDRNEDNDYEIAVRASTGYGTPVTLYAVTISVENQDEPGKITFGSAQPQVNTALEAELTDPDGGLTDITWKWERSSTKSTWTTIANEETDTYTPAAGDLNQYLRATASYTDGESSGKTANTVSGFPVKQAPTTNTAPGFPSTETGIRSVTENAGPGENIGSPVTATDTDTGDALTYSLGGTHAGSFAIDERTGQLKTKSPLDYEDRSSYFVTVTATDPSQESATKSVTINVVNVNEPPEIEGETTIGYEENDTSTVAAYTGDDPEGSDITWGLSGPDDTDFTINEQGELTFRTPPNYEAPTGYNGGTTYRVTILGSDGDNTAPLDITVTVTNQDEKGTITLSSLQPKTDSPLTATLRDPDGGVSNASWVWERSMDRSNWTQVTTAVLSTYTPVAGDIGHYLRVTVTYHDAQGTGKSEQKESANPVQRGRTTNQPPAFPQDENGRRRIAENTDAGTALGDPLTATDPDTDDLLTYQLGGPDADHFEIVASSGQLQTKAALDFESRSRYEITVTATDAFNASVSISVAVTVTNEDETGTVILSSPPTEVSPSSTQPQVGTPFAATLTDPDGTVSGVTWQWQRAPNETSPGVAIDRATSSTYTPTDDDENMFLRAQASYTDPQGPGKTADAVSKSVDAAPPFKLSVAPSHINEGGRSTITVATRNGEPATQTATIALFFGGTAAEGTDYTVTTHSITINPGDTSGTAAITALRDASAEPAETITIAALHNNELVGSATVTIRGGGRPPPPPPTSGGPTGGGPTGGGPTGGGPTGGGDGGGGGGPAPLPPGANHPPEFTEGSRSVRTVTENSPAGANIGGPVGATDPEEDPLTYKLAGRDADAFDLNTETGQLKTKAALNYETKNNYTITIEVRDSKNPEGEADQRRDDSIRVTILIGNGNDAGWITLSAPTPTVDRPLEVVLTDPDADITAITWKWEKSPDRTTWTAITDATTNIYTPTSSDTDHYLRVTATYGDPFRLANTAEATPHSPVTTEHATAYSDVTAEGVHTPGISALAADGLFADTGCGPDRFCPHQPIQRWVMAIWLIGILGSDAPIAGVSRFDDIPPGQWWIRHVEQLADRQITLGCATNPPRYCPDQPVTRAQMATFLVRAFQLDPTETPAGFTDTQGNVHAANIDTLAAAGITVGCRTEPLRYCPNQAVSRAQMATFLHRALNHQPTTEQA